MQRRISAALVLLSATGWLASATTLAGETQEDDVAISDAEKFADGMLGAVHNTADAVQLIGGRLRDNGAELFARDLTGKTRSCVTTVASQVETIRSLRNDSYLGFNWDDTGHCTSVTVKNGSRAVPKRQEHA